jgi:hypothetical protein
MDIYQKHADRILRLVNGRNLTVHVSVEQERRVRNYVRYLNRTLWADDQIGETDADLTMVISGLIDTGLAAAEEQEQENFTDRRYQ